MEVQIKVHLPGVIKEELKRQGEIIDVNKSHSSIYVAYSCNLLDEDIINKELQDYATSNRINAIEMRHIEKLTEIILSKHILSENSSHSIKNKEQVFRK